MDAERLGAVARPLWSRLFTPSELAGLHICGDEEALVLATVIFSAKEAFFKCQHAVTGAWLEFTQAEVQVSNDSFTLHSGDGGPDEQAKGRFVLVGGLVITATAWEAG